MPIRFSRHLRANLVLMGLSVTLAVGVILLLAIVCRLVGWRVPHPVDQCVAIAAAALFYIVTRMKARAAYHAAYDAGHLTIREKRAELIADHPSGWLIQLHLELHAERLRINQFAERRH